MGVNTIIIQQEKMSVPAKMLSEENLFTRPLNDSYTLKEAQLEFNQLVDYGTDAIRLTLQNGNEVDLLSSLLRSFAWGDNCYTVVIVYSSSSSVSLPVLITSMIEKNFSVHWDLIRDLPMDTVDVFLCPMNEAGKETYRIDCFWVNHH